MAYAKRTCHNCGMIKPVNYMTEKTVKVNTGSSSQKATGLTVTAALLGNQKSMNHVKKRLFANNKRGYVRNKKVWECKTGQCHRTIDQIKQGQVNDDVPQLSNSEAITIIAIIVFGGLLSIWMLFKLLGWFLFG